MNFPLMGPFFHFRLSQRKGGPGPPPPPESATGLEGLPLDFLPIDRDLSLVLEALLTTIYLLRAHLHDTGVL